MVYDTINSNNPTEDTTTMTDYANRYESEPIKKSLTMGAYLKSMRLQKNLTEDDIYHNLKIKPRIVSAIENNHYANLPDTVTVTALVRQYASFLGLDTLQVSNAYKNEMTGSDQKIEVVFPDKLPSSFKPFKQSIIATVIAVAIYSVLHILGNTNNVLPKITPVTELANETEIKTDTPVVPSDTPVKIEPLEVIPQEIKPILNLENTKTPEIFLHAKGDDSWIELRDATTNRVIYSGIIKNGTSYQVPSDLKNLRLKAGNSVPLSLSVNDEFLDILPKTNRVLRNFNLDSDNLLEMYKQQKTKIPPVTETGAGANTNMTIQSQSESQQ